VKKWQNLELTFAGSKDWSLENKLLKQVGLFFNLFFVKYICYLKFATDAMLGGTFESRAKLNERIKVRQYLQSYERKNDERRRPN